jgi:hypothetical protein
VRLGASGVDSLDLTNLGIEPLDLFAELAATALAARSGAPLVSGFVNCSCGGTHRRRFGLGGGVNPCVAIAGPVGSSIARTTASGARTWSPSHWWLCLMDDRRVGIP